MKYLKVMAMILQGLCELMLGLVVLLLMAVPFTIPVLGIVYICNKMGTFNLFIPLLGALIVAWLFFEERYLHPIEFRIRAMWDYYLRKKHEDTYEVLIKHSFVQRHRKISDWQRDRKRRFKLRTT